MFVRLLALKIVASALIGCATAAADSPSPQDLPNDCAIVATEAFSRLTATGSWVKMLELDGVAFPDGKISPFYHVVTAWQPYPAGHILIYDRGGTLELKTNSRDIRAIATAIHDLFGGPVIILRAHFL